VTYRWVDHTAELELELEGEHEEDVYRAATEAFAELVEDEGQDAGETTRHPLTLDARDRADLLVAFLEELVYLADTEGFVPERVDELVLRPDGLHAVVAGRHGAARPLVKAVTYHGLRFGHEQGRWRARIVLDV
jgi:SHS2 domain-containing protein